MEQDERQQRLKELLGVLKRGIEIDHFQISRLESTAVVRRVFWLDHNSSRFCIDDSRPTLEDVERQSDPPPGVYLRDVAEVREGWDAHEFRASKRPPMDAARCLSVVGSERTIAIQFTSHFLRDWFYERLCLLHEDVLSDANDSFRRTRFDHLNHLKPITYNSYSYRKKAIDLYSNDKIITFSNDCPSEISGSPHSRSIFSPAPDIPPTNFKVVTNSDTDKEISHFRFISKLKRGVSIIHHNEFGSRVSSLLTLDEVSRSLTLKPQKLTLWEYFSRLWRPPTRLVMPISDISELRFDGHTLGFLRSDISDSEKSSCLSIIGTQCVFDIQMDDVSSKDDFHDRLRDLVVRFKEEQIHSFFLSSDTLL